MQLASRSLVSSLGCRTPAHQDRSIARVLPLSGRRLQRGTFSSRLQPISPLASSSKSCGQNVILGPFLARGKLDSGKSEQDEVPRYLVRSWEALKCLLLVGSGGNIGLRAAAAWAEEIIVDPSTQATDETTQTVLRFLFTAAFLGLSLLTIGVVYLAVTEWLEKREGNKLTKSAGSDQDNLGAPVRDRVGRLAPRGFGKKPEKAEERKAEQKS